MFKRLLKSRRVAVALTVYVALWGCTFLFGRDSIFRRVKNDENRELANEPPYPGSGPLVIYPDSFCVPAPLLARVVWITTQRHPYYEDDYCQSGWFLWSPFGTYQISKRVVWARH